MIGKYFRAVLLIVLHKVIQFWITKIGHLFPVRKYYAVLKQLVSPTVIYKLKMISNDLND